MNIDGLLEEPKRWIDSQGDRIGIVLSSLCLAHCLLLPPVAFLTPVLGQYIGSFYLHLTLFLIIVPVAIWVFIRGYHRHGWQVPLTLSVMGVLLLVSGLFIESFHFNLVHDHFHFEEVFTIVGSLVLVLAHWLNIRGLKSQS